MKLIDNIFLRIIYISVIITFWGCPDGCPDPIPPNGPDPPLPPPDTADTSGNLIIINETGGNLYLFVSDALYKAIWDSTGAFLIDIPTSGFAKTLKVWKADQITDIENPGENPYRRWDVVLATSTNPDDWSIWVVSGGDENKLSGSVFFNYPEILPNGLTNIYSVDVHLNTPTGAKITALNAGTDDKQVGLSYGFNYLYFHYWFQDPGTNNPLEYIGWVPDSSESESDPYEILLNTSNSSVFVNVPTYQGSFGYGGRIDIYNQFSQTVRIWCELANEPDWWPSDAPTGNLPIEMYDISERPPQDLSYISSGNSEYFILRQTRYNISVTDANSQQLLADFEECDINVLFDLVWAVNNFTNYHNTLVTNFADERLIILDNSNNNYLGFIIETQENRLLKIPDWVTGLLAINWDQTKQITMEPISSEWFINNIPYFAIENQIIHTNVNHNFSIEIVVGDVDDLMGVLVEIVFDTNYLQIIDITPGGFLGSLQDETVSFITTSTDDANNSGFIEINSTRLGVENPGISGTGTIAYITFQTLNQGTTEIMFTEESLMRDIDNNDIPYGGLIRATIEINE